MKIYYIAKYIYYIIGTLFIVIFGSAIFFLYNNFYNTLAQVKIIYILKNQVTFENIDMTLWNKVIKNIENKKKFNLSKEDIKFDPFKPILRVKD